MSDRMAEFNVRIDARSAKLECWIECTDVRKNEREMPDRMSAYARKYVRTDARQNARKNVRVCYCYASASLIRHQNYIFPDDMSEAMSE